MENTTYSLRLTALAERLIAGGDLQTSGDVLSIALGVRRLERALDEIVADAAEDERLRAVLAPRPRPRFFVVEGDRP